MWQSKTAHLTDKEQGVGWDLTISIKAAPPMTSLPPCGPHALRFHSLLTVPNWGSLPYESLGLIPVQSDGKALSSGSQLPEAWAALV